MMKKYWKLTVLCVLIISVISIYLIGNARLTNYFPQFVFDTAEGDEAETEPIVMNGVLDTSMFTGNEFQTDIKNGTRYFHDESFLKRLETYYRSDIMEQRVKEHRNFMRGKDDFESYYYEDDTFLAYANTSAAYFSFEYVNFKIDVLNKETGERIKAELPIPGIGEFWYADVQAVKLMGDQLKIFTVNDRDDSASVYQYTFDLNAQEITESKELYAGKETANANGYTELILLLNPDHNAHDVMVADRLTIYQEEQNGMMSEVQEIKKLVSYDLETDEQSAIELPENAGSLISYNEKSIYYTDKDTRQPTIIEYDRDTKKIVKELDVNFKEVKQDEVYVQNKVQDDKLYMVRFTFDSMFKEEVAVIDLSNMKKDFIGEIVPEYKGKTNNIYEYYFNDFNLKANR